MDLTKIGLSEYEFQDKRMCDGCPQSFSEGDHLVIYFCDTIWNDETRGKIPAMIPEGAYCFDCYQDKIPLPRKGTKEGFTFAVMQYNKYNDTYSYEEEGIVKGSTDSEGIRWEPDEVFEKLHHKPIDELKIDLTPMSTFTIFHRLGIDLRGFVHDGQMSIPNSAIDTAREVIRQNAEHRPRHTFNIGDL